MNDCRRALAEFQDFADDVSRARHSNLDDALRRFVSTLAPGTPLGRVVAELPTVDFAGWYSAQLSTVRSMVGSGTLTWPESGEERLAMQVAMVRGMATGEVDILQLTTSFMWAGTNVNDNVGEFVQQVFRPFVRDFLRHAHRSPSFEAGLREPEPTPMTESAVEEELALFISHSGRDVEVAKRLVALFEKSLKISARAIRCTSVDGYRLRAGADTNEVLRTEVFVAKLFIALLTPASLDSSYVLFELGARWGARRALFPVLAGGATPANLEAPLSGLNALSAAVGDQVRQLVEDAAAALSKRLEPLASFSAEIDALVEAAARPSQG